MNIETEIKHILVAVLNLNQAPDEISDDLRLLGEGLPLDSISALLIVLELEKRFSFEIRVGDISREIFTDVKHLADFVRSKINTGLVEKNERGNDPKDQVSSLGPGRNALGRDAAGR